MADSHGLMTYANLPATVGCVVSSGLATLVELDEKLGVRDLYDLVEIVMVDSFNKKKLAKAQG